MKYLKTKSGVIIEMYSSADELPIQRYSKFQKFLVSEASSERLLAKLERIKACIEEGNTEDAKAETNQAISCLNSIYSGVGYTTFAFACLVSKIGDKVALDLSDAGLSATLETLDSLDISQAQVVEANETLKKKSKTSWKSFFQSIPKGLPS